MTKAEVARLQVGDTVQIDPAYDPRFGGCFMQVTEPKPWGAQGFVPIPDGEGVQRAFYRCPGEHMAYVGEAPWVSAEHLENQEQQEQQEQAAPEPEAPTGE